MKIFIIMVSIISLSAVIAAIIVGNRSFEGVVVEKPYEQGLLWDKQRRSKADTGWNFAVNNKKFKTGDNEIIISVFKKDGKPLSDASVYITVSRPFTTAYDKDYRTVKLHGGLYSTAVNLSLYGYWDMKIHVAHKDNSVVFEERIFAERGISEK